MMYNSIYEYITCVHVFFVSLKCQYVSIFSYINQIIYNGGYQDVILEVLLFLQNFKPGTNTFAYLLGYLVFSISLSLHVV